jgi:hypothetical protein
MSLIHINGLKTISKDIPGVSSVSFTHLGKKVTAIQPISKISSVFISEEILASDGFIKWLDVNWSGVQNNFDLGFFVRSSNSSLTDEKWSGPFYNSSFDIDSQRGKYLQFMVCMVSDGTFMPSLDEVSIRYVTSSAATKFYTKSFELGFKPETILLTFNADLTDDTIVNFYVSGDDSIDPLDYQRIEPNKIEDLNGISYSSENIKLLMELSGEFNTEVAVHEISFMVGGDQVEKLNN